MTNRKTYLAIDAGGTNLKSAVLNGDGEVLEGSSMSTKSFSNGSREEILDAFRITILTGLKFIENAGNNLDGIGVAFPGPFDCINGIPLMKHKFSNIYGVNLRDWFRKIPGILSYIPISFIPDANAVLSGELWKGNAQGFPDVAVVTLGTGLGFAFSQNGKIQSNNIGGPLVTIYRVPYKEGILEDYVSRNGILEIYSEISRKSTKGIDVSDLGRWADEEDQNCIQTFNKTGRILGEGIHDIIIELDIRCLLIGGQISRSFHHMANELKHSLEDIEKLQKLSVVKDIDNAALFGAFRAI